MKTWDVTFCTAHNDRSSSSVHVQYTYNYVTLCNQHVHNVHVCVTNECYIIILKVWDVKIVWNFDQLFYKSLFLCKGYRIHVYMYGCYTSISTWDVTSLPILIYGMSLYCANNISSISIHVHIHVCVHVYTEYVHVGSVYVHVCMYMYNCSYVKNDILIN